MIPLEALMDPEKYGYQECPHCSGYGSSLYDPDPNMKCSKCGGSGLQKKEAGK